MKAALGILLDVGVVLTFVTLSRLSHNQVIDAAGVLGTAWPFLLGLLIGWLVTRSWRTTLTFQAALWVFVSTLAFGIAFRHLTFTGAQPSFVAMAFSVLSVLLMGWRLIAYLELRRRATAGPAAVRTAR